MPLELLVTLVIGGIAAIALAAHLLGLSAPKMLDPATARAAWLRHFPDDAINSLHVARSGHAALVHSDAGWGLLWSFGADTVARRLTSVRLSDRPKGLRVDFDDYTAPPLTLRLHEEERARWKTLIEAS
ncbi:hypothetical protein [Thalassococcus sp. S3]|uniref:hypothetical protein n=1 Tax=Thalassococcus sp. S3 TaxID=2017482 RepID=UPI001024740A|nr:hypothetical protein [Thalassococcus sp. S3]QBF30420.1 hypothetical protein CFI11_04210 [Thalassococcus sp. S3]